MDFISESKGRIRNLTAAKAAWLELCDCSGVVGIKSCLERVLGTIQTEQRSDMLQRASLDAPCYDKSSLIAPCDESNASSWGM